MNIVCAAVRTKALYEKKDKEIIISTLTVNVCYDKITFAAVNGGNDVEEMKNLLTKEKECDKTTDCVPIENKL